MKKCSKCKEMKPLGRFYQNRKEKDGRNAWCKECVKSSRQSAHSKETVRRSKLKRKYGMTVEEYDCLLAGQNGVCVICGKKEVRKNQYGVTRLSVDHNHKTGEIRGLLCNKCNVFLGHLESNYGLLFRALDYLNR